jgi:VanZ family protein
MGKIARNLLWCWLPLFAYVALIFGLSSLSSVPALAPECVSDKVLHFLEYCGLGWLACRAVLSLGWPGRAFPVWLLAFVFASCLGGADELYQSFVPLRTADVRDWVADLGGGAVGGLLYLLWLRWTGAIRDR